jgi:hypothetical protein
VLSQNFAKIEMVTLGAYRAMLMHLTSKLTYIFSIFQPADLDLRGQAEARQAGRHLGH